MKQTKAPKLTPSPRETNQANGVAKDSNPTTIFMSMVMDMTWRLAIVVVVPILIGSVLDSKFKKGNLYVYIGLVVALIAATSVMYRSYKLANDLTKGVKAK
jgi:F0F1-type ATP synthase assembly protein I